MHVAQIVFVAIIAMVNIRTMLNTNKLDPGVRQLIN